MDEAALKIVSLLQQAFEGLASQLGVAAPKVWEILVRQQLVMAVQSFTGFLAYLLVCFFVYKICRRTWHSKIEMEEDAALFIKMGVFMGSITLGVVGAMLTFNSLPDAIGRLMNPEFYALQTVLQAIKWK